MSIFLFRIKFQLYACRRQQQRSQKKNKWSVGSICQSSRTFLTRSVLKDYHEWTCECIYCMNVCNSFYSSLNNVMSIYGRWSINKCTFYASHGCFCRCHNMLSINVCYILKSYKVWYDTCQPSGVHNLNVLSYDADTIYFSFGEMSVPKTFPSWPANVFSGDHEG